eukprot:6584565-Pyramimonas_sp.AAC.1
MHGGHQRFLMATVLDTPATALALLAAHRPYYRCPLFPSDQTALQWQSLCRMCDEVYVAADDGVFIGVLFPLRQGRRRIGLFDPSRVDAGIVLQDGRQT